MELGGRMHGTTRYIAHVDAPPERSARMQRPPERCRVRRCMLLDLMHVLTHNYANALECARTRDDRQNYLHSKNPWRTGLTGFTDRSDRCRQGTHKDLDYPHPMAPPSRYTGRVVFRVEIAYTP